jgi:cytochrome b
MPEKAKAARVWDPLVRCIHWALAATFLVAWFSHGGYLAIHRFAGYAIAALVAVRIAWGFAGAGHARFAEFVPDPRSLASYAALLARGREPRYIGHNPAGGAMIVLLLALLATLCISGIVLDTPRFRDDRDVMQVHDWLTDAALACIALHVAGVAYASWRHGENLVSAMITGRKRC